MAYDSTFYNAIRGVTIASAEHIVPMVIMHVARNGFQIQRVIDIGGGQGWWAKSFKDYGAKTVMCIDGSYVEDPVVPFMAEDLTTRITIPGLWDVAVCLEVGEHLPEDVADRLVLSLCVAAPVVLFSAAIPEQGGEGHVNEQAPSYWAKKFDYQNYVMSGYLRDLIWDEPHIASWYRQNLMLALRKDWISFFETPAGFYTDVPPKERIHPATGNPRLKEHQT
jgi:hypothetical protein